MVKGTSMAAFWWRPSSWFIAGAFSLCPHLVEGARGLCGSLWLGTMPIHQGSSCKGPTYQCYHLWGLGFHLSKLPGKRTGLLCLWPLSPYLPTGGKGRKPCWSNQNSLQYMEKGECVFVLTHIQISVVHFKDVTLRGSILYYQCPKPFGILLLEFTYKSL